MSAGVAKDYVTVEDYLALPDGEWQKWELSNGELVPRYGDEMGARVDHNSLRVELTTDLSNYLRANPVGRLLAEQDYQLGKAVRRPDMSVVLTANLEMLAGNPAVAPGAPDLAIEIVSPSNRFNDVEQKVSQLHDAGCQVVWLIQHALQRALVCEPGFRRREVKIDGALEAPELLPGFRLELRELFERAGVAG